MDKQEMLTRLYADYATIVQSWTTALDSLQENLVALDDAKRQRQEFEDSIQVYEDTLVMAEMHDEGRINGSNAAKRKRQTAMLLADLPDEDPQYKAMLDTANQAEQLVSDITVEIEATRQKISFLRSQAKMIGGLAYALGG